MQLQREQKTRRSKAAVRAVYVLLSCKKRLNHHVTRVVTNELLGGT